MGDVHHGSRKKKPSGQNQTYYYSLTYDEDDEGSLDDPGDADDLRKRVDNILAETEIDVHQNPSCATESIDGRLDLNENLFGGDGGSQRHSRSLDFELSDDEEFQSAESKSDTCRPDLETASIEEDFVQITRPMSDPSRSPRDIDAGFKDDGEFASGMMTSEQSPKTSAPVKRTGNSPLSVVYVKQKTSTELYDGNFIDDDIFQHQDDTALGDNISQDLLPMSLNEMTLEMEEDNDEDDGIPDTASGVDADPIIFRKSSQRWSAKHRKLLIGVALIASLLAAGGLAAVIYFAVTSFS